MNRSTEIIFSLVAVTVCFMMIIVSHYNQLLEDNKVLIEERDNYKDIANDVKDLIPAGMKILDFVKNYSGDNFQRDFISALAEVVHNDVNNKTNEE